MIFPLGIVPLEGMRVWQAVLTGPPGILPGITCESANAALVDDVGQLGLLPADRSGQLIHGARHRGARSLAENGRRGDPHPLAGSERQAVGIQAPRGSRL